MPRWGRTQSGRRNQPSDRAALSPVSRPVLDGASSRDADKLPAPPNISTRLWLCAGTGAAWPHRNPQPRVCARGTDAAAHGAAITRGIPASRVAAMPRAEPARRRNAGRCPHPPSGAPSALNPSSLSASAAGVSSVYPASYPCVSSDCRTRPDLSCQVATGGDRPRQAPDALCCPVQERDALPVSGFQWPAILCLVPIPGRKERRAMAGIMG